MEQSRLKINDKEVGLRNLGGGLFEPKNFSILKAVVNGQEKFEKDPPELWKRIDLPLKEPKQYHKIESFCFVATENIKEEAELLLRSLRNFHDQPVYVICDKATRVHLTRQKLCKDVTFRACAEQKHLDKINEKVFKNHSCVANNIHNASAIFKKMDVMDFALEHHSNTFFLDADIIVLDNLQEYFQASVVLSPHYYPRVEEYKGFEFGFYNAGYLFCASKGFPRFWKHAYLTDSIFFEQECMNRILEHYNIQTFSEDHNVGFWRGDKLPQKAKSVHAHVTSGVDKNRNQNIIDKNTQIKDYAISQTEKHHPVINSHIRKYYNPDSRKKLAFIHFGKCAGVYVQYYIREYVFPGVKHFNSWWDLGEKNKRNLERDWTKQELIEIAKLDTDTGLAHNHHIGWCSETVQAFKNNGWFTFMFLRDPKNIICSLYFWSQRQHRRWKPEELHGGLRGPLRGEIIKMSGQDDPHKVSIDDFFKFFISNEEAQKLWTLPDYIDDIEYVSEFNDKNFGDFLLKYFGHHYLPQEKRNISQNKGYEYYLNNGDISKDTNELINNHSEYIKYSKYMNIKTINV